MGVREKESIQRKPQAADDGLPVLVSGIKISSSEQDEDSQGAEIIGSELALPK
ncbi:hypothetical protein E2562_025040, partial [Oryza meyeriana var. granulata]